MTRQFNKYEIKNLIPPSAIDIKVDSSIEGTKSTVRIISLGGKPLYALKAHTIDTNNLFSPENNESMMRRYNLEKTVLTSIPRSEIEESFNGIKIQAMPLYQNADNAKMWLLLQHVPYESLNKRLKEASTLGKKIDLLTYSLNALAYLHHILYKNQEKIRKYVELERITSKEITARILRYLEILYEKEKKEWPFLKKLEKALSKKTDYLVNVNFPLTLIHNHYYAHHIRLNDERVVNLDMSEVKEGPLELDLGCLLGDIYYFFKEEAINFIPDSMNIYVEKMKKIEEKEKHEKSPLSTYPLNKERIYFSMVFANLRKAAGITHRNRQKEMDEKDILVETAKTCMKKLKEEYGNEYSDIYELWYKLEKKDFSSSGLVEKVQDIVGKVGKIIPYSP